MSRPTQAIIDLSALRHNYAIAQDSGRTAYAVIKANAYGHGIVEAAKALQHANGLAVACVDEALVLREHGLKLPILVLQGWYDEEELIDVIDNKLEVVLHHPQQIKQLADMPHADLVVWLKMDTGMHRLGFPANEIAEYLPHLNTLEGVREVRMMTHFADADDVKKDTTEKQMLCFYEALDGFTGQTSVSNSAAILGWPDVKDDICRPGIMLYGVSPIKGKEASDFGLKPVMTLSSRIIALHNVEAGETVGYGSGWSAERDSHIAVVAIGYGDGYPRHAQSGTPVMVRGRPCPLAGRVSMDMITIDVSALNEVSVGDEVILWGNSLPIERLAEATGTIGYELLCQVTQRVPRIYE